MILAPPLWLAAEVLGLLPVSCEGEEKGKCVSGSLLCARGACLQPGPPPLWPGLPGAGCSARPVPVLCPELHSKGSQPWSPWCPEATGRPCQALHSLWSARLLLASSQIDRHCGPYGVSQGPLGCQTRRHRLSCIVARGSVPGRGCGLGSDKVGVSVAVHWQDDQVSLSAPPGSGVHPE